MLLALLWSVSEGVIMLQMQIWGLNLYPPWTQHLFILSPSPHSIIFLLLFRTKWVWKGSLCWGKFPVQILLIFLSYGERRTVPLCIINDANTYFHQYWINIITESTRFWFFFLQVPSKGIIRAGRKPGLWTQESQGFIPSGSRASYLNKNSAGFCAQYVKWSLFGLCLFSLCLYLFQPELIKDTFYQCQNGKYSLTECCNHI